jgi:hypothetical protein
MDSIILLSGIGGNRKPAYLLEDDWAEKKLGEQN